MTVVSSILFGIGAAIALMTIWTSYRSALPALRILKRQLDSHAETSDLSWTSRESQQGDTDQSSLVSSNRFAARRRPIRSTSMPRRRASLAHHHAI